jgi:hypothetical protein
MVCNIMFEGVMWTNENIQRWEGLKIKNDFEKTHLHIKLYASENSQMISPSLVLLV